MLGGALKHLDVGLAVFFVLTGFLLYRPIAAAATGLAPAVPVRLFYWRRILRIGPAYWVALLVLAPLIRFAPSGLPNVAFLQVYRVDWVLTGIAPAWSLGVEAAFYAFVPLYALGVQRVIGSRPHRHRNELLLLGLGTIAALAFREMLLRYNSANAESLLLPPATFPWFATGMALAVVSTRARASRWLGSPVCWALAAAVYAITLRTDESGTIGRLTFLCYGLIGALLVAPAVFGSGRLVGLLRSSPLAWLGLCSYGIYLYHFPIIGSASGVLHGHGTGRAVLLVGIGIGSAIVCGAASYYLIERHALRFKEVARLPRAMRRLLEPADRAA
ncbi:MAG: acyltransferase [Solirubrobacterales bacterium]|nr:acyltransferase [Solirubrobacterales bacterium]